MPATHFGSLLHISDIHVPSDTRQYNVKYPSESRQIPVKYPSNSFFFVLGEYGILELSFDILYYKATGTCPELDTDRRAPAASGPIRVRHPVLMI